MDKLLDRVLDDAEHSREQIDAADALQRLEQAAQSLDEIATLLRRRTPEVMTALDSLAAVRARLRFQTSAWPEVQKQLEAAFLENADDGLAKWLALWGTAVSEWRLEAAQRIADAPVGLPAAAALMRERLSFATIALREGSTDAAIPTLRMLSRGAVLGKRPLMSTPARGALHLLLVRLLLERGPRVPEEARDELGDAADLLGETVPVVAARASIARLSGAVDEFQRLVSACRPSVATDLGALVEQVHSAADTDPAALETVVREGVPPLLERDDVVSEAERLRQHLPAALWLHICKESQERGNTAVTEYALSQRDSTWRREDASVAWELTAELYRRQDRARAEIAEALVLAGDEALLADADDSMRARRMYERALELDHNTDTTLRLANAIYNAARSQPLAVARDQLVLASSLVERARSEGAVDRDGWSFLTEAYVRFRLADEATASSEEHSWAAVLAVLRALALRFSDPGCWGTLAYALQDVNMHHSALRAAQHSLRLAPGDEDARDVALTATTNLGRYREALELLDGLSATPLRTAARGHILLRLGRGSEAFAILRELTLTGEDEYLWWAWYAAIDSANTCGDEGWAWQAASTLWKLARQRPSESDAWKAGAFAALELGKLREVEARSRRVLREGHPRSTFAHELLGSALILQGDSDGGMETLMRMVEVADTFPALDDVEVVLWPRLERLARRHDVVLPHFGPLGSAVARAKRLMARQDDELPTTNWPLSRSLLPLVVSWTTAVLAYAEGDLSRTQQLLGDVSWQQPMPELDRFRTLVAATAEARRSGPEAPIADLTAQNFPEPGEELGSITDDGDRDHPIGLGLPPSWFAQYSGRELEHPIFVEYLPRVRTVDSEVELPPVKVYGDPNLEPASYQVRVAGTVVESGAVDVEALYCLPPALELLTRARPPVRSEVSPMTPDLVVVTGRESLLRRSALALLTMTPAEVVVRRTASAVKAAAVADEGATAQIPHQAEPTGEPALEKASR
jgi:tetratricopeptide (TPR) repeat protein